MRIIQKIEKLLRIKRCQNCGRIMWWWDKGVLRYIESPKDFGYYAPACSRCRAYAEQHQFDN